MSWEITVDEEKCTGCGTCVDSCPQQVLELPDGKPDGKPDPTNIDDCLGCETCVEECPEDAITVSES